MRELFRDRVEAMTAYGLTEASSAVTSFPDRTIGSTPTRGLGGARQRRERWSTNSGRTCRPAWPASCGWRGPNIVQGYWNRPEETARVFTDGWHHSGDVAVLDDTGLVRLVDRIKDVVIRAGENVFCGEVEAVLHFSSRRSDCGRLRIAPRAIR